MLKKIDTRNVRDPFAENPYRPLVKKTKRTQRYRSTAKSRICGMTVGDIRYCFQQLRNAGNQLCPEFVLYNGQCAGEFALSYLIETSNSMKRKKGGDPAYNSSPSLNDTSLPESQLNLNRTDSAKVSNLMEFL
ncbi:unknown [Feldmannia species virus]|uniref:Uncharacterized protein n=1 Tax=Feldmannia species virus TaxID=39420 RepID=B5LWK5_9PHYC|nr:hypothetical protein FeldSpV_gp116 [Feldmannia species virus]ACH46868.1 unknown [Feldmannia species virus]